MTRKWYEQKNDSKLVAEAIRRGIVYSRKYTPAQLTKVAQLVRQDLEGTPVGDRVAEFDAACDIGVWEFAEFHVQCKAMDEA